MNVRYRLTLASVSPSSSSTSGGALITIDGSGFGKKKEDLEVNIGGVPCDLESVSDSQITCYSREYYKTHQVYLTGESWYPQEKNDKFINVVFVCKLQGGTPP